MVMMVVVMVVLVVSVVVIAKTLYNKMITIQMRVIHCAVLSPFNGSWNYALASVSSYTTSDNLTTLASK